MGSSTLLEHGTHHIPDKKLKPISSLSSSILNKLLPYIDQILIVHDAAILAQKPQSEGGRKGKVTTFLRCLLSASLPHFNKVTSFGGLPSLETRLTLVSIRSW